MKKFFNRTAAQAEATRLAREIQKHDQSFTAPTLSLGVGKFNAEIDALNARVAAAKASGKEVFHLSVPQDSPARGVAAKKPATVAPSAWSHVHDASLRALMEKAMPGGPAQLKASSETPAAPKQVSPAPAPVRTTPNAHGKPPTVPLTAYDGLPAGEFRSAVEHLYAHMSREAFNALPANLRMAFIKSGGKITNS